MAKSASLHIRLGFDIFKMFKEIAKIEHRSFNNVVEAALMNYAEEYKLLTDPEFKRALKQAEKSNGTPWRKVFKNV